MYPSPIFIYLCWLESYIIFQEYHIVSLRTFLHYNLSLFCLQKDKKIITKTVYPVLCTYPISPTLACLSSSYFHGVVFLQLFFHLSIALAPAPSPPDHVYKITSKYKLLPLLSHLMYRMLLLCFLCHASQCFPLSLAYSSTSLLSLFYNSYSISESKILKSNINFPQTSHHSSVQPTVHSGVRSW